MLGRYSFARKQRFNGKKILQQEQAGGRSTNYDLVNFYNALIIF